MLVITNIMFVFVTLFTLNIILIFILFFRRTEKQFHAAGKHNLVDVANVIVLSYIRTLVVTQITLLTVENTQQLRPDLQIKTG